MQRPRSHKRSPVCALLPQYGRARQAVARRGRASMGLHRHHARLGIRPALPPLGVHVRPGGSEDSGRVTGLTAWVSPFVPWVRTIVSGRPTIVGGRGDRPGLLAGQRESSRGMGTMMHCKVRNGARMPVLEQIVAVKVLHPPPGLLLSQVLEQPLPQSVSAARSRSRSSAEVYGFCRKPAGVWSVKREVTSCSV